MRELCTSSVMVWVPEATQNINHVNSLYNYIIHVNSLYNYIYMQNHGSDNDSKFSAPNLYEKTCVHQYLISRTHKNDCIQQMVKFYWKHALCVIIHSFFSEYYHKICLAIYKRSINNIKRDERSRNAQIRPGLRVLCSSSWQFWVGALGLQTTLTM